MLGGKICLTLKKVDSKREESTMYQLHTEKLQKYFKEVISVSIMKKGTEKVGLLELFPSVMPRLRNGLLSLHAKKTESQEQRLWASHRENHSSRRTART